MPTADLAVWSWGRHRSHSILLGHARRRKHLHATFSFATSISRAEARWKYAKCSRWRGRNLQSSISRSLNETRVRHESFGLATSRPGGRGIIDSHQFLNIRGPLPYAILGVNFMAAKQSNQTVVPAGQNRAGDGTDAAVKRQPVRQPIPTPIPAPGVFESDVALPPVSATFEFIPTADSFAAIGGSIGIPSSVKILENYLATAVAENSQAIAKLLARKKGKTFRVQCNFVPPILDEWKTALNELVFRLAAGKSTSASLSVGRGSCIGELSPSTPQKGLPQKIDSKFITDRAKRSLGDEVGHLIEDAGVSLGKASLARTDCDQDEWRVDTTNLLEQLQAGLDAFQVQLVHPLQEYVKRLEGKSFGTFEADRMFAKSLHKIANRLRLRVRCPHCGEPAILRFHNAGRPPRGVYQFEHSAHGKKTDHGGGVVIPKIEFVDAPIDRRERP